MKKITTEKDVKYRILCKSIIGPKNEKCRYSDNCIYAHDLEQQIVDELNKSAYDAILFSDDLSNILLTEPDYSIVFKKLFSLTNLCDACLSRKCSGGFNCKYGSPHKDFLICKTDFLQGSCREKEIKYVYSDMIKKKFNVDGLYIGCINGQHLTCKKLLPYSVQYIKIMEFFNDSDDSDEEITIEIVDITENDDEYVPEHIRIMGEVDEYNIDTLLDENIEE